MPNFMIVRLQIKILRLRTKIRAARVPVGLTSVVQDSSSGKYPDRRFTTYHLCRPLPARLARCLQAPSRLDRCQPASAIRG